MDCFKKPVPHPLKAGSSTRQQIVNCLITILFKVLVAKIALGRFSPTGAPRNDMSSEACESERESSLSGGLMNGFS